MLLSLDDHVDVPAELLDHRVSQLRSFVPQLVESRRQRCSFSDSIPRQRRAIYCMRFSSRAA
jgi:hypothetical protein